MPALISWNVTHRCNLRCAHCYLDAGTLTRGGADELSTNEGLTLVGQIAEFAPGTMLVLSGGEPLLRPDLLQLARYAAHRGLMVVVGTNGILLDDMLVGELMDCGVRGVGISLDSLDAERHDDFRGAPGAWERTRRGIAACYRQGLAFQIQTTVTTANYDEIPDLITFAAQQGALAFNLFFLVCTGRGQSLTDITPTQYEDLLSRLAKSGGKQTCPEPWRRDGMMVRARCAPHLRRLAYQHDPTSPLLIEDGSRCLAGVTYCRITPEGQVTPCPYMPIRVGHVREQSFAGIWRDAPIFHDLRNPILKSRCGRCEFATLCGGCRARAYATTGDYLEEDPWCAYQPGSDRRWFDRAHHKPPTTARRVVWSEEAAARLEKVPLFLRNMVRRGVEAYAREKGLPVITPAIMSELKAKRDQTSPPAPSPDPSEFSVRRGGARTHQEKL